MQALQQGCRCPPLGERLDGSPRSGQRVKWKIDAIESSIVFAAVLKVVVDLQSGA